jgi:hypothetical protein
MKIMDPTDDQLFVFLTYSRFENLPPGALLTGSQLLLIAQYPVVKFLVPYWGI